LELAMTIKDNFPLIRQYSGTIFNAEFVEDLVGSFDDLLPALARMDNKDKTDQTPAGREDVVGLLRNLDQNAALVDAIVDGFDAAGPVMMLTTQALAIQTLMRNPEEFAEKVQRVSQSQAFKDNPTARGMRDYILDSVTKKRHPVPRTVSVWDDDDAEDDVQGATRPGTRRAQGRGRARQFGTPASAWQQDEDDWGSSVSSSARRQTQRQSQPSRAGRKRPARPPVHSYTESDSDSGNQVYTQRDPAPSKRR